MIEATWESITHQLQFALSDLDDDEFVVISLKRQPQYFVQFSAQGALGMRIEAASNFYIPESDSLTAEQHALLVDFGWQPPSNLPETVARHQPDGSPNYFLDIAQPVPYDSVSRLSVKTLISVYGAKFPIDIEYSGYSDKFTSIRFPTLGIKRKT
jgi:hypothetical protein